jgi:hypothetical protein
MKRHPQNFCSSSSGPFTGLLPLPLGSRIDRIVHPAIEAGVNSLFPLAVLKHITDYRLRFNVSKGAGAATDNNRYIILEISHGNQGQFSR